jgi:S1-C subfamily serine protease
MQLSTRRRTLWANLVLLTLSITLARAVENTPALIVEATSSDSLAAKAGLKPADRIISYDGKPLPSPAAFDALQQNTFGKQEVVLQIRRRTESLNVTVPLGPLGIETRPELPPPAVKL